MDILKLLNILKTLIDLLPNVFHWFQKNKYGSTVKTVISGFVIYVLYVEVFTKNHHYDVSKSDTIIREQATSLVKECGSYSFVSWAVVNDQALKKERRKFHFKDVIGCLTDDAKHCGVSVMDDNPIYNREYTLSYDDYYHLQSIPAGKLIHYNIVNGRIDDTEDYTPQIMSKLVASTNLPLRNIRYTLVRDYKQNLVYIFSLSFTNNSKPTCSSQIANTLLLNLADTAENNL